MPGAAKGSVPSGTAGGHGVFGLLFPSSDENGLSSGTLSLWQPAAGFAVYPAPGLLVPALPAVTAFCSSGTPT